MKQDYLHSYPHCHRCDKQLFYNAIPAWFLSIEKLRQKMIEQNKNINWYPEHLKKGRFQQGIEQAPDWNISRNRYFATPIPIWECDKCEKREVIGSIKELEEKSGQENIKDIHSHFIDNLNWICKCGGKMKRISEVFDCWIESGSMSFAQHHYPFENKEKFESTFPAQYISEYISQTRAWFYVMHVLSTALFDKNSFENVVTTGVILNEKGEKMSKSKKNYPDPWKVIDEFGVDSLRFYMMSSPLMHAENLFFNERELRDVFRKNIMLLWNVYKFYSMFESNSKFNPEYSGQNSKSLESNNILDKWILARLNQLVSEATDRMDNYDMPRAMRPITDFIDDFSTWYLRRSRDRFKGENEDDKNNALATTKYVLTELSKVMAPFMPFISEQIWQRVTGNDFQDEDKSVHLENWPKTQNTQHETSNKDVLKNMEVVRKIVELGLAKRDEVGIKVRQPLRQLSIFNYQFSNNNEDYVKLIKDEVNVKKVFFVDKGDNLEVELDVKITEDLEQEGIKRELVRLINAMRKKEGLTIDDKILINFKSDEDKIKKAIEKYKDEIIKETLAKEIKEDNLDGEEIKVNGSTLILAIEKV